jgi:hypothetical protein
MQNYVDNIYLKKCAAIFETNVELSITSKKWLLNNVQKVVDLRIESSATNSVKRFDLLQLMMDASTSEKITVRILTPFYRKSLMLYIIGWC